MAAPFKPTPEEKDKVQFMAGLGVPQEIIAKYLNITKPTLHKHFREELDSGMAVADMRIAESLFNQAISGNTSAAIFWAKARMGWSEKVDHQHNGEVTMSIRRFYEPPTTD